MRKFWNFAGGETGERTLYLNGPIASETWFGDEITPGMFKADLDGGVGPLTVWINSDGGDVFAAARIYKAAITEAMFKGTARNVVSEGDSSKNTPGA